MTALLLALQLVSVEVSALPAPGGFVDAELRRRQDSARDLEEHFLKDVGVRLRPSELRVIVTSSQRERLGDAKIELRERPEILGGGQRAESRESKAAVVRVRLEFGAYRKDFVGMDRGDVPSWRQAAEDVARQISTWVRDNRERICRESATSCQP